MTVKEKVLKVWPDAHWVYLGHKISKVAIWGGVPIRILGEGITEEAAWQNAAESLLARREQILDRLEEALHRGEVFAQEIRADVPEHVWDEFGLGKVEPLPVEAKDSVCCFITCNKAATWQAWDGPQHDDYTEACNTHLGHLLSDKPEHRVWPLTTTEPKPTPSAPAEPDEDQKQDFQRLHKQQKDRQPMSEPGDKQVEQPKVGELPPLELTHEDDLKALRNAGYEMGGNLAAELSCRERQLLAEQQVSAGLREELRISENLETVIYMLLEAAGCPDTEMIPGERHSRWLNSRKRIEWLVGRAEKAEAALVSAASDGDCPRCQYRIGELLQEQKLRKAAEASLVEARVKIGNLQLEAALLRVDKNADSVKAELATLMAQNTELADLAWHVQICDGTMSQSDFIELVRVRCGGTKALPNREV